MSKSKDQHYFDCATCKAEGMTHADMLKHLETVHEIDTKNLKGTRQVLMHADAKEYYLWTYKWTFECDDKLELVETVKNYRRGQDKKIWASMEEE